MLAILLGVLVISFSGVMAPGPMFAVTLAKSYRSPLAGTWISLGHAVIEVPIILLIYFGFGRFFENETVRMVLSLVGGVMLVWLGIDMFRSRRKVVNEGKDLPYNSFIAGILMSAMNPFFLLWWATIGGMLIMRIMDYNLPGLAAFTAVHWLCDLIWLTFISVLVYKTKTFWGGRIQQIMLIACALLLVGFGGWFLISGIKLF